MSQSACFVRTMFASPCLLKWDSKEDQDKSPGWCLAWHVFTQPQQMYQSFPTIIETPRPLTVAELYCLVCLVMWGIETQVMQLIENLGEACDG